MGWAERANPNSVRNAGPRATPTRRLWRRLDFNTNLSPTPWRPPVRRKKGKRR